VPDDDTNTGVFNRSSLGPKQAPIGLGWLMIGLSFLGGIAVFAYLGTFMRYSADDYCQAFALKALGFWDTQIHTYRDVVGIYSHTFVSSIADLSGPKASRWIPGLLMLAWILGVTGSVRLILRRTHLRAPIGAMMCIGPATVYLTVYQAPDRAQSLFWRSGAIAYMAPLALFWLILLLGLWVSLRGKVTLSGAVTLSSVSILSAGFSETAAALQLALLILGAVAVLALTRPRPWYRSPLIQSLAVAVVATMISILLIVGAPSTPHRLAGVGGARDPLSLLTRSMRAAISFTIETVEGLPLPTALTLAMGFAVGAVSEERRNPPGGIEIRASLAATFGILGAVLVAISAVYGPALYAYDAPPDQRTMLLARHILVVGFLGVGIPWGRSLANSPFGWTSRPRLAWLSALALVQVVLFAYPIHGASRMLTLRPLYARWAEFWDTRHAAIIEESSRAHQGVLHVVELENIIPNLGELRRDPNHYSNRCAASYYGVESIVADLPGW
jgi:hypothetical protein